MLRRWFLATLFAPFMAKAAKRIPWTPEMRALRQFRKFSPVVGSLTCSIDGGPKKIVSIHRLPDGSMRASDPRLWVQAYNTRCGYTFGFTIHSTQSKDSIMKVWNFDSTLPLAPYPPLS